MSQDISQLVEGWPYDSNEVHARWIQADDGTRKVQLRLDLGVFQMEVSGRPDGTCPLGNTSLLEYYLAEEKKAADGVLPYQLDTEACAALQQEVMQYYYRIMAFHALGEWGGVLGDGEHNLDLIDLVSEYAADDEIAWQFSQLFPYMCMMTTRAKVELAMKHKRFTEALQVAREAESELDKFFKENYEPENEDGTPVPVPPELESVRELLAQIESRRPRSEAEILRKELARAVELENYEKAAFLRDRLKGLQGFGGGRPAGKKRSHTEGRNE
ncbi:MAG: UvrB/UvrC motif-containing protein [Verrucomicrobiota bacterium]|jgi:hypothetical protein|nr:UvrB/UvrC motif-containing protein [Verrucomicrobiota bacterium]